MSQQDDLLAAITAAESAENDYQSAVAKTTVDQNGVSAAQAKLDAASAQAATSMQAQDASGSNLNAALDNLIAAATAAKIGAIVATP